MVPRLCLALGLLATASAWLTARPSHRGIGVARPSRTTGARRGGADDAAAAADGDDLLYPSDVLAEASAGGERSGDDATNMFCEETAAAAADAVRALDPVARAEMAMAAEACEDEMLALVDKVHQRRKEKETKRSNEENASAVLAPRRVRADATRAMARKKGARRAATNPSPTTPLKRCPTPLASRASVSRVLARAAPRGRRVVWRLSNGPSVRRSTTNVFCSQPPPGARARSPLVLARRGERGGRRGRRGRDRRGGARAAREIHGPRRRREVQLYRHGGARGESCLFFLFLLLLFPSLRRRREVQLYRHGGEASRASSCFFLFLRLSFLASFFLRSLS